MTSKKNRNKIILFFMFVFGLFLTGCTVEQREEVEITFHSLGGSPIPTMNVYVGDSITKYPTPELEGYHFSGWYLEETFDTPVFPTTTFQTSVTLYAKWEIITSTVTFYLDEATVYQSVRGSYNQLIEMPIEPEKEGYSFEGWYQDNHYVTPFTLSHYSEEDYQIYAKWKLKEYVVKVFDQDELIFEESVQHFTFLTPEMFPVPENYQMDGLYLARESLEQYDMNESVSSDLTLYINYVPEGLTYEIKDTTVTITGYNGVALDLILPKKVEGLFVQTIGRNSFENSNVTSVIIPSTVEVIGSQAFKGSQISSVLFESVSLLHTLEKEAFQNAKNLDSFELPTSVVFIGESVFQNSGLTHISIDPHSELQTIQNLAFSDTLLQSFYVPKTVTVLSGLAFIGSLQLVNFQIDPENISFLYQEGSIFSYDMKRLIAHLSAVSYMGQYNIPVGVESIGWSAFAYSQYTNIVIPNTVTEISSHAFAYTTHLQSIRIPKSVTNAGYYLFYDSFGTRKTIYIQNGSNYYSWLSDFNTNMTAPSDSPDRKHFVVFYS